jgi:Tfp pilus assembly protein PilW
MPRGQRGSTLLEMVVATALLGLIAVTGIGLVRSTLSAMSEGVEVTTQQARARAALATLCNELRQSGRNDPDDTADSRLALDSSLIPHGEGPHAPNWVSFRRVTGSDASGQPQWSATTDFLVTLEPTEGVEPNGMDDDGDGMVDELWLQRLDSTTGETVTLLTDVRSFGIRLAEGGRRLDVDLEVYATVDRGQIVTQSWDTSIMLRNR